VFACRVPHHPDSAEESLCIDQSGCGVGYRSLRSGS
jgi:hypothetical protein